MRFGIQMYGLNPVFTQDPEYFLERITAAGYRYVEPCLMFEEREAWRGHGWTAEEWEVYAPILRKFGIKTNSCHFYTRDIRADLERLVPFAKLHGVQQIVLACPVFAGRDAYEAEAQRLQSAAKALNEEGIELLLHNDRGDSEILIDGVMAYEWLLHRCGGLVGAQADVGWLLYGGTDPEEFLWRNQQYIRSLHYKDMEKAADGYRETAIGRGCVDMTACAQFARAAEVIQIFDQDGSQGDILRDAEQVGHLLGGLAHARANTKSILCIMDTQSGEVTRLRTFDHVVEAPNWMRTDGDILLYNSDGHMWKYSVSADTEEKMDLGFCTNCNNDHVLSPDERLLAVSHSQPGSMSQIFTIPVSGGEPKLITPNMPSYLHGWSPDGKELAYCAFRDHGRGTEVDVYAIDAEGGEERRLTKDAGFNDGPEYSPDGKHIWFNSTRTGLMQCWRMDRDGADPVQMTFSRRNNWFPHVSPDGSKVVYLSYSAEGLDAAEHLPNMQVQLHLMNTDGSEDRTLLRFFGGQGSINVNSWSADSRRLAFVMYELEHK